MVVNYQEAAEAVAWLAGGFQPSTGPEAQECSLIQRDLENTYLFQHTEALTARHKTLHCSHANATLDCA